MPKRLAKGATIPSVLSQCSQLPVTILTNAIPSVILRFHSSALPLPIAACYIPLSLSLSGSFSLFFFLLHFPLSRGNVCRLAGDTTTPTLATLEGKQRRRGGSHTSPRHRKCQVNNSTRLATNPAGGTIKKKQNNANFINPPQFRIICYPLWQSN